MGKQYQDALKLLAAIGIIAVFGLITPFEGLSRSAMLLIGIFIGSVFLWISVGISWPSLFCLLALALLPELSMNSLISSSIGNPAISFLIFTFCCSYALNQTLFTRRCAIWFLSTRLAKRGPWPFLCLYFFSVLLLGSCMSTTVIVVLYLTINEEIFSVLGLEKGDRFAALMTMGLIITASISGAMTPIAHVFPLMALNSYQSLTGQVISYSAYMAAGIPAALCSVGAMLLIFRFILRPDTTAIRKINADFLKQSLRPGDKKERLTASIFFGVVALWVLPELLKPISPAAAWLSGFGTVMPPLLGTMLMCIIHTEGKPLLSLGDGAKSVPWPSMFMAASALTLGSAMTNPDIGLSEFIKTHLGPMVGMFQGISFVLLLTAVTAVMTNVGSNMVTITIVCTVALPIAASLEGIHVGALAVTLGMMATYAYATPPAMTTVVLGTGSGWTTNAQMAQYGFLILIPCIVIIALVAYPIAAQIL
ncbi:MAG: SLC13 family permease [Lachnospiraceae bacterium]|nr:SLC13 family permease [Lachnospiraceae bacterium]